MLNNSELQVPRDKSSDACVFEALNVYAVRMRNDYIVIEIKKDER